MEVLVVLEVVVERCWSGTEGAGGAADVAEADEMLMLMDDDGGPSYT